MSVVSLWKSPKADCDAYRTANREPESVQEVENKVKMRDVYGEMKRGACEFSSQHLYQIVSKLQKDPDTSGLYGNLHLRVHNPPLLPPRHTHT